MRSGARFPTVSSGWERESSSRADYISSTARRCAGAGRGEEAGCLAESRARLGRKPAEVLGNAASPPPLVDEQIGEKRQRTPQFGVIDRPIEGVARDLLADLGNQGAKPRARAEAVGCQVGSRIRDRVRFAERQE